MSGYPVVDAGPAAFRPLIAPLVGVAVTPVVAINGGASAASRHIDDASPTLAETLTEQVHWVFSSADAVQKIHVGLNVQAVHVTALSAVTGEVVKTHEVAYLKVVVNPGDDVTAATRLLAGGPEVFFAYPGNTLEIEADVPITDVYVIAALATGTVLQGGSTIDCTGASYV